MEKEFNLDELFERMEKAEMQEKIKEIEAAKKNAKVKISLDIATSTAIAAAATACIGSAINLVKDDDISPLSKGVVISSTSAVTVLSAIMLSNNIYDITNRIKKYKAANVKYDPVVSLCKKVYNDNK